MDCNCSWVCQEVPIQVVKCSDGHWTRQLWPPVIFGPFQLSHLNYSLPDTRSSAIHRLRKNVLRVLFGGGARDNSGRNLHKTQLPRLDLRIPTSHPLQLCKVLWESVNGNHATRRMKARPRMMGPYQTWSKVPWSRCQESRSWWQPMHIPHTGQQLIRKDMLFPASAPEGFLQQALRAVKGPLLQVLSTYSSSGTAFYGGGTWSTSAQRHLWEFPKRQVTICSVNIRV